MRKVGSALTAHSTCDGGSSKGGAATSTNGLLPHSLGPCSEAQQAGRPVRGSVSDSVEVSYSTWPKHKGFHWAVEGTKIVCSFHQVDSWPAKLYPRCRLKAERDLFLHPSSLHGRCLEKEQHLLFPLVACWQGMGFACSSVSSAQRDDDLSIALQCRIAALKIVTAD